jgi:glycosyltransferase involved in cell wall biosynthesis/SAM-dependent methyltransferase
MIVKNEMANLARCLGAVVDHVDCWIIGDTGSTDGTQEFVRSFFASRKVPGQLHEFPFHNFEQARNAALDHAYASPLDFDYLLFDDADMELVVEDAGFRDHLVEPGYRLLQRSDSGLAYWNTRLVRRDAGARYVGVTHEYVDVPGGVKELRGLWYKDHASGSNRVDKFERDIRLLLGALETEPENHRYWYYLAQSYRDAGRTAEAAVAYAKRAAMGGWDEEAWNARLQEARCLRALGDDAAFVRQALVAFNQRPQRVEPIYDLARFYREKQMYGASVLFSEAGLQIGRPEQDILFIEDFAYTAGVREEYAIAANYASDPARKDRGFSVCDSLALDRHIGPGPRDLARSNLHFYAQSAQQIMPSYTASTVGFEPPAGYRTARSSIARSGGEIVLLQRCAKRAGGQHDNGEEGKAGNRYFLLRLSDDLALRSATEVVSGFEEPLHRRHLDIGLDGMHLVPWQAELWVMGQTPAHTEKGVRELVLARIDDRDRCRMTDLSCQTASSGIDKQGFAPFVEDDAEPGHEQIRLVAGWDPTRIVDFSGHAVSAATPAIWSSNFRSCTQAIAMDGGWLTLVGETLGRQQSGRNCHRFAWIDGSNELRKISRPFRLEGGQGDGATGLSWHPDGKRVLFCYSGDAGEAHVVMVDIENVRDLLRDVSGSVASPDSRQSSNAPVGEAKADQPPPSLDHNPAVPRLLHFITGLDPNFGGKPFSFIHYMAIRSALSVNSGYRAKLYFHHEPSGPYWDAIKPDVELVRVDLPDQVFGNPVEHFAHKADVLRLRILLEQGGIYLDLDTICQRPFEPLLDGRVVLGREELPRDGVLTTVGLCNATIIAPSNSEFLHLWYETYRDFTGGLAGDAWNKFSVQVPMALARERPELVRIEPAASFFWPPWDAAGLKAMFEESREFPEAYSFHLWESQSWPLVKDLDAKVVLDVDTTYNRIARRFVTVDPAAEIERRFSSIYAEQTWGRGSGVGSAPNKTVEYRAFLQNFMAQNDIRSVVDFGCGDWQFSRYIDWSGIGYVGIDIAASVVERNQSEFGAANIRFETFRSLDSLPAADLLVCKDVLQHLPNGLVKAYLAAFRRTYKFALITNDEEPAHLQNAEIEIAGWRTLKLDRAPFNEQGAAVFSWPVLWGAASTRKSTFLLLGEA